ncbi:5-methylcytosine-specific restriction enzyme A [Duganella sp. OV458]|nr:5-methylcytosine-specific restriction enzyme A [Duganella sp. OV458]SDK58736.1 5-methylcytosine-specific restriction enzyme A [Duganella sp. OV510]
MTLSVILPRRGWTLLKKTKNYAYLRPPLEQSSPPFYISIAVPTPEECLALARRSHTTGRSWFGQLGEWPTWYYHERNTNMREIWRDSETGEMASRIHHSPPQSSLSIGERGAWNCDVTGTAGEFLMGILPPHLGTKQDTGSPRADTLLSEGAIRTVELTTYERNEKARQLCIDYYGHTCCACGLNYEDRYGVIGAGLIHVHHITPLSAIGEEYQVDPILDLIPLCASCHHVVHGRNPPYSLAEVKEAIARQETTKNTVIT